MAVLYKRSDGHFMVKTVYNFAIEEFFQNPGEVRKCTLRTENFLSKLIQDTHPFISPEKVFVEYLFVKLNMFQGKGILNVVPDIEHVYSVPMENTENAKENDEEKKYLAELIIGTFCEENK